MPKAPKLVAAALTDDSPLERMHLSEIFKLLYTHGCIQGLKDADYKTFRRLVTRMVLATDLSHGYNSIATIKAAFPVLFIDQMPQMGGDHESGQCAPATDVTSDLLNLVVECADISHAAKPLNFHQRWAVLITHEFLLQGQLEEERGLPISPLCSRATTMDSDSFARSQQGFIDFVVRPKLSVLSKICAQDHLWMFHLEQNHAFWGSDAEVGFVEINELIVGNGTVETGIACARSRFCSTPASNWTPRSSHTAPSHFVETVREADMQVKRSHSALG